MRNARVIGVGVTSEVGESLEYMVTDSKTDIFRVDNFFKLQERVENITREVGKIPRFHDILTQRLFHDVHDISGLR